MTEGFITRWLLKEGDAVKEGEPLFEMETDKLVITIDATCSGKLLKILYPEGSTVPITTVIAYVGEEGDAVPEGAPALAPAAAPVPEQTPASAPQEIPVPAEVPAPVQATDQKPLSQTGRVFATPRARTTAAERGYDLREITPSGPEGLIIERDVLSYAAIAAAPGGKMLPGAMPCILSARITLFSDENMTPEAVLRLAYQKALERSGIDCGDAEPIVRVLENRAFTFCMLPSAETQLTVCSDNLTLAFYPNGAEEEAILEFFGLLCMFAEKPWLAAVK